MASLSELSPRAQLLVFALLAAGLVFAGESALLGPQETANDSARQQVKTLQATNQRLRPLVGRLAQLETENRQLDVQWKQAQAMLPEQRATDDFLRELQQLAARRNLHLRRVQAQPMLRRQYYLEAPYKVLLDGTYGDLLRFYQDLNGMSRIVSVKQLTLNGIKAGSSNGYTYTPGETLKAECVITTYFSPLAQSGGVPAHAARKGGSQ
jgi:type IV pilus assembly protein PilO